MDLGYIKVTYFVGRALPVNGKSVRYRPARVDPHRPVLPSLKDPLPNGPPPDVPSPEGHPADGVRQPPRLPATAITANATPPVVFLRAWLLHRTQ